MTRIQKGAIDRRSPFPRPPAEPRTSARGPAVAAWLLLLGSGLACHGYDFDQVPRHDGRYDYRFLTEESPATRRDDFLWIPLAILSRESFQAVHASAPEGPPPDEATIVYEHDRTDRYGPLGLYEDRAVVLTNQRGEWLEWRHSWQLLLRIVGRDHSHVRTPYGWREVDRVDLLGGILSFETFDYHEVTDPAYEDVPATGLR